MASQAKHLLSVEEFLEIEFDLDGVPRVELDNGVVWAMAGGSAAHNRVQGNIFGQLFVKLRGTGCRPHGPDMGIRTHDLSLRYPDVSVLCGRDGPENDGLKQFDDPRLIVEILSPSTRHKDEQIKLPEYMAVRSAEAILYIDPEAERVQLYERSKGNGWIERTITPGDDVVLSALGVTLSWAEIFARG